MKMEKDKRMTHLTITKLSNSIVYVSYHKIKIIM